MKLKLVLSIAALALAALIPATAANAGTYTVYACKAPGGGRAAISWTFEQRYPSNYFTGDHCPGGYFWMDLIPTIEHPGDDFLRANFIAPPNTDISAYSLRRSVQLSNPYHYNFHEAEADGSVVVREKCFGDAGCTGLGDYRNANAASNLVESKGRTGLHALGFSIYCRETLPGPPCPPGAPANNFQLHGSAITLTDSSDPTFQLPPSGPLLSSSGPLAGKQQVFVWAADRGGGVRDVLFEVDGTVVDGVTLDDNDGRCREPFSAAQPCKLDARGTVSFDTAKVSDGQHQLRLLVTDATGTNMAAWGPVTIQTANGTCEPEPRSDALTLHAGFATKSRARIRAISYGQRPGVRGQVTLPDGSPAGGVAVCIADQADMDNAPLRRVASVTTDAKGQFRYTLRHGSSRRLYFVARVDGGAVSDSLRVKVRAATRLRASRSNLRNGQLMTLQGKLIGGPFPHRGVLVEVQVLKPNKGWQTFGTTRATRTGSYQYRYRFTNSTGSQRYRFRAHVPVQNAYPYLAGASRSVGVTVRG